MPRCQESRPRAPGRGGAAGADAWHFAFQKIHTYIALLSKANEQY